MIINCFHVIEQLIFSNKKSEVHSNFYSTVLGMTIDLTWEGEMELSYHTAWFTIAPDLLFQQILKDNCSIIK